MALTGVQKVGIALGFIPGVSTIVGAIKAFVYFRRGKKHELAENQVHKELNSKAVNIHDKALTILKETELCQIKNAEKQIGMASLCEMVPGVNVFIALIGATATDCYPALSRAQQHLKDLKTNSDEELKKYLVNRYLIADQKNNSAFMEAMEWIFVNLDDSSRPINFNTVLRVTIFNQIPELIHICREKSQGGERDSKKMLAEALTEIIDKRYQDENIMKTEIRKQEALSHFGLSPIQVPGIYLKSYAESTKRLEDLLKHVLEKLV